MDIQLIDEGSTITFMPHTDAGRAFLRNEMASERRYWRGEVFCVDRHLAETLAAAAVADRLGWRRAASMIVDDEEADDQ